MIQENKNESLIKIGNWIAPKLNRYELILALLISIGMGIKISTNLPVDFFIIALFLILSVLYFFNVFAHSGDENAGMLEVFLVKLASWSNSTAIIGILFRLQNWHGFDKIILLSCITLLVILPVMLVIKIKKNKLILLNNRLLLRVFTIGVVGLLLCFTTTNDLIKYKLVKDIKIESPE